MPNVVLKMEKYKSVLLLHYCVLRAISENSQYLNLAITLNMGMHLPLQRAIIFALVDLPNFFLSQKTQPGSSLGDA